MTERARPLRRRARRGAHRALRRTALCTARPLLWRRPPPRGDRLRVRILLQNAHGTGGTIRTVLNLSGRLARDHDVEIVSVVRSGAKPFFPIPDGVTVTYADDRAVPRGRAARLLARLPSVLIPKEEASFRWVNLWTDLRLLAALRAAPPDVLIATRPSLNLLAAALSPRGVTLIGQDHMSLGSYKPPLRRQILRDYRRLDVLTTLTEAARAEYEHALAGSAVRIVRIPNAVPDMPGGPSRRTDKVVLAAGRLVRNKRFDLLIEAFEPIAAEHPGWTLRIFGAGARRAALRDLVAERGLTGRVEVHPASRRLPAEMERAAIYALTSRREGMPMVVIEAMTKGLAVVSTDCPHGPGEMIDPGRDGLLVPVDDAAALTAALRRLVTDPALRDRLGEQARRSARAYDPARIAAQWAALLADLHPPPRVRSPAARVPRKRLDPHEEERSSRP
ncbi:glycosyltransferase family 4 protein [Actinomadura algeriensis]|uniref:Glycosyltransferase involved in cell wall biosynthesis n=1 Tax=Actinomadura algeriensis TaxID=1679523 RepID=A0ABR9JZ67_9ACTN|nr:glycosyltransferase family 4 protein [Actinomadura algeriensis]MBE1535872.1 glycosyltransferase involved in cell wall biosynthesis [Actinomadura algeriensis]